MTHICSQLLFCDSFRKSIQTAALLETNQKYNHIFWVILKPNSTLTVFDKLDGVYQSYRSLVVSNKTLIGSNKTLVFFLPETAASELKSPYAEFHPCLIHDEKLKQCDIEKITFEEMKYICVNNKFPERISSILKNE